MSPTENKSRSDNTNSEVLLGALEALTRAAKVSTERKIAFITLLKYWMTSPEDRETLPMCPRADAHALFADAALLSSTEDEKKCIANIMERGYLKFAPAEFLSGCM